MANISRKMRRAQQLAGRGAPPPLQVPWPPMAIGHSNRPLTTVADVEKVLAGFRDFAGREKLTGLLWAVKRNPRGETHVFLFSEDCVPASNGRPWRFFPLAQPAAEVADQLTSDGIEPPAATALVEALTTAAGP